MALHNRTIKAAVAAIYVVQNDIAQSRTREVCAVQKTSCAEPEPDDVCVSEIKRRAVVLVRVSVQCRWPSAKKFKVLRSCHVGSLSSLAGFVVPAARLGGLANA
jgi:hypothetical protein